MAEQTIQSRDINVADVFQAFYAVPDYQREYVWQAEQVEQLLNDINAEIPQQDPTNTPEYFIGSIVVCPGPDGVLELIDGQQRMTTLFLTLCAIRDHVNKLGKQPPGALASQIAATSTDAAGNDHFRHRLDLQYEDSGDILVKIAEGNLSDTNGRVTRSITNIRTAYEVILSFLKHEFGDDANASKKFYGYLTNKVKLIRIQTEEVAKALKIFETINDRGVGLDSMDLLKNLLFMKASREDFSTLKIHWKKLQDVLFEIREKPLRFLRYFIFSRYDVDILREDEIYGWFARNERVCGYAEHPIDFANELLRSAAAYKNFLEGKNINGDKSARLENLQLLGGRAARQHLILLLAGRHLPNELFNRLSQEVEELFFVYVITREPTRYFERNFARWAIELRRVQSEASLLAFIKRYFVPSKMDLSTRFDDALRHLYSGSVQKYRLRYILAKLTQHIEIQAHGRTQSTKWLSRYIGGEFEIEHIFPRDPSDEAEDEFGEFEDPDVSERLGNLVLVEGSINASLGNKPYSEKRKIYPQSQLLLTKALSERPRIGTDTRIDRSVANLEPFREWNEVCVNRRQEMLLNLSRLIWGLDKFAGDSRPI